jgi:hypothetical protein
MKIMLIMKDKEGRTAQIVADGEWNAFDPKDCEAMKRFAPEKYCEITCAYDDGGIYRHYGYFPMLLGQSSDE